MVIVNRIMNIFLFSKNFRAILALISKIFSSVHLSIDLSIYVAQLQFMCLYLVTLRRMLYVTTGETRLGASSQPRVKLF